MNDQADSLGNAAVLRRGIEAAIWGVPAVNFELMYREMVDKLGGEYNQIVYWSRLLDWKNQTLTPNPDVIYFMPFFDTSDVGPMVLEIPPADDGVLNGSVMNFWQAAIEDIGPGGMDEGRGGKYLILPPGYDSDSVPQGYVAMPCDTYRGYALVRSVLRSGSDADVATAVEYGRRMKLYPLSEAANPSATTYVDAIDVIYDATIPYDIRFFESLNRMIQAEPWRDRDKAMIDQLKTIGIERGTAFSPSAEARQVLNEAMTHVKAELQRWWARTTPFYDGDRWFFPVSSELQKSIANGFTTPDSYPVDERGWLYTFIYFSARHAGEAQYYLMATEDTNGQALRGDTSYRVNVPAEVPVTQYWSLTVYNRDTHTLIRNARRAGRSSQTPGLSINDDGSVDVYFGPHTPAVESNWVPTDSDGHFEVLARFYGPEQKLFDKTWRLGGIERIAP
ncbi:DUF1214 domain-containing protein [Mycolicibacterium arenosum]|uniref:DUF1254 domain-containing protein n=1 Tax=Mycolicibacterium arenosum TaxID=2952157 RepID=A0ABT1MCR1_9MYCO|nr:DUF1254 domain-containing protein [Mycolicibacterium sp. CAU 1645]MCP9276936.1 DUF1254 domain-containing protein [Mycolicibacterium sp. CAU 1645]